MMSVDDYLNVTGKELTEEEGRRIEYLIEVFIEAIENALGYSLKLEEVEEILDYNKRIYLSYRPVVELLEVPRNIEYKLVRNYIDVLNFKKKCCCVSEKSIIIKYIKGYETLPKWLIFKICEMIDNSINSMSDEYKYSSYKIDDISYSIRNLTDANQKILNDILKGIYD